MTNKYFFDRFYNRPELYYGDEVRPEFEAFVKEQDCQEYHVLDLGCGEGRYSLYLSNFVKSVTAIDFSLIGINKLRKLDNVKNQNYIVICEDVNLSVLPSSIFDLVVMATLLDHLDSEEQKGLMVKVYNSLKSGGIVYANAFTTQDPGYKIDTNEILKQNSNISETSSAIRHYFRPSELRDLFTRFEILEYREFVEEDISHGPVHNHGWAYVFAQKRPG